MGKIEREEKEREKERERERARWKFEKKAQMVRERTERKRY